MSTLTIGFSNTFYTLWSVGEPYKEYVDQYSFYWKVDTWYLKNLSMDLDAAKAKVEAENPGQAYKIDLDLKG
jgi:hypothetical protein